MRHIYLKEILLLFLILFINININSSPNNINAFNNGVITFYQKANDQSNSEYRMKQNQLNDFVKSRINPEIVAYRDYKNLKLDKAHPFIMMAGKGANIDKTFNSFVRYSNQIDPSAKKIPYQLVSSIGDLDYKFSHDFIIRGKTFASVIEQFSKSILNKSLINIRYSTKNRVLIINIQ